MANKGVTTRGSYAILINKKLYNKKVEIRRGIRVII